jgi:hypothetical protein
MKVKKSLKAGDYCHPAVEVQCLEESGYLAEKCEGKDAPVKGR